MKYKYLEISRWANKIGYSMKKTPSGYSWWLKGYPKNKHRTKALHQLISEINNDICPVGSPSKINTIVETWRGFMAFEPE